MISTKPLSGMRDFNSEQVYRRNYIINIMKSIFELHGFSPIETPCIENLDILNLKYGEDNDKLIYKIDSDKGLRYDLTIPLARYVIEHYNDMNFPFKRYQIQQVWRKDRPQKGRFREFTQCDLDILGSNSILNEIELVSIYKEVLDKLNIKNYIIKINHKDILFNIIKSIGLLDKFELICTIIDKLDKIGWNLVKKELLEIDITEDKIDKLFLLLTKDVNNLDIECNGINELIKFMNILNELNSTENIIIDFSLARGLNYYNGMIFEVIIKDSDIGSIGGGGRYDNLTSIFGKNNISSIGISFGLDRIYHIMENQNLFQDVIYNKPFAIGIVTKDEYLIEMYKIIQNLRNNNIPAILYEDCSKKLSKQFTYADNLKIHYVLILGDDEFENNTIKIKDMNSGDEEFINKNEILEYINNLFINNK